MKRTVHLPGRDLEVEPTGERKRMNDIADGGLFEYGEQIWEKLPGSHANLSDLDDGSEIIGNPCVVVWREVLTKRQEGSCE